jgi:hypothetical protein
VRSRSTTSAGRSTPMTSRAPPPSTGPDHRLAQRRSGAAQPTSPR